MRSLAQKQNQAGEKSVSDRAKSVAEFRENNHVSSFSRAVGNQGLRRLLRANSKSFEPASDCHGTLPPTHAAGRKPLILQARLTVNTPGDMYEQEADQVAEQVMAMSESQVQRNCDCETGECSKCRQGQAANKRVQTKRVSGNVSDGNLAPPEVNEVVESSGQPLDSSARSFWESRFGHDFSHVRVHTDAKASASALALNATAYTVGHHIAFAAGQFAPETRTGRHLIAHELTHTIQQTGAIGNQRTTKRQVQRWGVPSWPSNQEQKPDGSTLPYLGPRKIAFVREQGLNLREQPDQKSNSYASLQFGQRVYVLIEPNPQPGWLKVAVLGRTGYVSAPRIHFPPENLITKDPGLSLVKVKPGQTFWGLVKEVYGIQGNEGAKDQNINHFINAIKAVNKPEAFTVKEDTLDKIGNFLIPGREATDTYLKAGVDLWIPSFGVAAKMDVGSGTIRGELTRIIRKIDQKLTDFKTACAYSIQYIPGAIAKHVGDMASALLDGLIDFAKDAATILAISTAIGALIGALFGGVGAIPGAEIGFEIGLIILEYYGLFIIIEAVLQFAVGLVSKLADFVKLVWVANGDQKQLKEAGKTLADALGMLVSSVLVVLVAYLLKKGGDFIKGTKFGKTVGESRLATWLEERKQGKTTRDTKENNKPAEMEPVKTEAKVTEKFRQLADACYLGSIICGKKLPNQILKDVGPYPKPQGFNVPMPEGPFTVLKSELSGVSRSPEVLRNLVKQNRKAFPEFDKALKQAEAKGLDWVYDASGKPWEVHHNKPVFMGGGNNIGNLIPLPKAIHLEFSNYWQRVFRGFKNRFTASEWDLIYTTDVKTIKASAVPK